MKGREGRGRGILLIVCSNISNTYPEKTDDIWRRHKRFPLEKTSDKRAQKYHTDDTVLTRHPYGISALVSRTSFRGETIGGLAKCRLFSQAIKHQATIVFFSVYCLVKNVCSLLGFWVLHERQRRELPMLRLKGFYCSVFFAN